MHCTLKFQFIYVLGTYGDAKARSNKINLITSCYIALSMFNLVENIPMAAAAAVSTFIYPTGKGNLTFALSATNTGDVYMHLSAPAAYQWVGVGTGSEMDGSVMFILYENSERNGAGLCR
jgi:hypothetical protein